MSSFQKCLKCDGSGKKWNIVPTGCAWLDVAVNLPSIRTDGGSGKIHISFPADEVCPVCNGKMIISTLTGKPPKD